LIEKRFVHAIAVACAVLSEIRKENRSGDKSPERLLKTVNAASLANAGA